MAFYMSRFANKWLSPAQESLSANESASVTRLVAASRQASTPEIQESFAATLVAVEAAAEALHISPTPRAYRGKFPVNYMYLFPGETRCYRSDVFEASLEHYNVIWVNGEKFEFSVEATRRAEELQHAWIELLSVLERWSRLNSRTAAEHQNTEARPTRSELIVVLKTLDAAWAKL